MSANRVGGAEIPSVCLATLLRPGTGALRTLFLLHALSIPAPGARKRIEFHSFYCHQKTVVITLLLKLAVALGFGLAILALL
jgi:hypothetical protein